jgi:hypothetical protein
LSLVVRDLRRSWRAYRLNEIAELFLSRPESHAVKIEIKAAAKGETAPRLYQCTLTRAVFLDRSAAVAHARARGLEKFYEKEETQGDPPTGHFMVVARCGLSGTLLGPPNHHSYARAVQDLHRERYARMPLEEYRSRIQTVRDPELIEQWKQEQCKRLVFREKTDGEPGPEMDRAQAEAHFEEHHLPKLIVDGRRFIAPAVVMRATEDRAILYAMREAWTSESRRPRTLLFALRPALRHMGMHIFRANGKVAFVTAVQPRPLAPGHAVQPIGEVLDYLHEHPGCTRQQLVDALRPGKEPTSPEVGEVLNPFRWLIERGHVIEFSNGTLSVPLGASRTA